MRDTKEEILYFWFEESVPAQWFQKNEVFDGQIRDRFLVTYEMAADGLCDGWSAEPEGSLALCILLDQFPRNMFRDSPRAFATDKKALLTAKYAVSKKYDQLLSPMQRRFIYLPYEHSEAMADQEKSLALFASMKEQDPMGYDYALRHYKVIERFGRFPHRNVVLGRENTPDEEEYLAQEGAGF